MLLTKLTEWYKKVVRQPVARPERLRWPNQPSTPRAPDRRGVDTIAARAAAPTGVHVVGSDIRVNDPSAGSPTETLLRLLLPLSDKVH